MSKFGFGKSTGLELGGFVGQVAGPTYLQENHLDKEWQPGNTWNTAIGQDDTRATPLQLATYVATLANGGTRYQAHLLKSVYEFGKDTPLYTFEQSDATVLDRIEIPEDVRATVLEGMHSVVESNSTIRKWMSAVEVDVGGKTGTAQTGAYLESGEEIFNALFVGAAPYAAPEVVVSVVLEEGAQGTYAAMTAARILEAYYKTAEAE